MKGERTLILGRHAGKALAQMRALAAERDAFEAQRDRLLAAIEAHRQTWDEMYWDKSPDRNTGTQLAAVWDDDQKLYDVADGVRGEQEATS